MQNKVKSKKNIMVSVISLGCPKNLVDSELILGKLGEEGYTLTSSWQLADIIIINTCSFINAARKESYDFISKISGQKSPHQRLIVCGCLPQLEKRKLFFKFPQINALLGTSDFYMIDKIVEDIFVKEERIFSVSEPRFIYNSNFPRLVSTPPGYAYLKIAEGCSNRCSYCLIPRLRGNFRSREVNDVVKEAENLVRMGVKELILTAQDTTFYGQDRGEKSYLLLLLEKLEKIKGIEWIRLLYLHPLHFDFGLIQVMKNSSKICRYLDIPLQHTHDEILKLMKRPPFEVSLRIIDKVREAFPEVAVRTSLMVGFPGEKEHHFEKLLKDVERLQFDWVGVFTYSREKYTPAFSLPHQVPSQVKEKRKEIILKVQKLITVEKNLKRIGKTYPVMVDFANSRLKEGEGHTFFQAPEIDGKIFFAGYYSEGDIFQGKVKEVKDGFDLYVLRIKDGFDKDKQERI